MKGPAWLYEVAKDSAVCAKDLCQMFGISLAVLDYRIKQGQFPPSDFRLNFGGICRAQRHSRASNKREWYVRTIIKHLRTLPA